MEPTAVHVRVMARVPVVSRVIRRTLARMIVRVVHRAALAISVRNVRRVVSRSTLDSRQLLVRRVAVVDVRKHRFGREETEGKGDHERRKAAQTTETKMMHRTVSYVTRGRGASPLQ